MSVRRGRPPRDPAEKFRQVRASLPPALLERVDAYAATVHEGNRSAALAELLRQGLELVRAEELAARLGVATVYAGACPRCGATFRATRAAVTCDCGEQVELDASTGPRQGSAPDGEILRAAAASGPGVRCPRCGLAVLPPLVECDCGEGA